jgi:hypothetical protein
MSQKKIRLVTLISMSRTKNYDFLKFKPKKN